MAEKAKQHGLNLALEKITHPAFAPDDTQNPNDSQTILYRLASSLFVKLPGIMGLVPKKYRGVFPNLRWNGDYVRRIDNKANLDPRVVKKIQQSNGRYNPPNIN